MRRRRSSTGRRVDVRARPADAAEFDTAFQLAGTVEPGAGSERVSGPDIRVSVLHE